MKYSPKRLAYIGVFAALSVIAFIVENLLPPLFIPGARIGLGNVFIILCLVLYSLPEAALLFAAKCLLSALFGGAISLLYSASAGAVSLVVTYLLIRFLHERLSVTAIASVSAVTHNLVQLGVFALATSAKEVFFYAPHLAIAGIVAGTITGLAAFLILKYFPFERKTK